MEDLNFAKYIRENHGSWLKFATEKCNRGIRLIDLVLVTGCHKTSSWACAAFASRSKEVNIEFNAAVGATQGGLWGRWSESCSPGVYTNSGPMRPARELEKTDDEENPPNTTQTDEASKATDVLVDGNVCVFVFWPVKSDESNVLCQAPSVGTYGGNVQVVCGRRETARCPRRIYTCTRSRNIHTWIQDVR